MTLFDVPTADAIRNTLAIADLYSYRRQVAARIARAEAAVPGHDPIGHRLGEYRACLAELDALIDEATR